MSKLPKDFPKRETPSSVLLEARTGVTVRQPPRLEASESPSLGKPQTPQDQPEMPQTHLAQTVRWPGGTQTCGPGKTRSWGPPDLCSQEIRKTPEVSAKHSNHQPGTVHAENSGPQVVLRMKRGGGCEGRGDEGGGRGESPNFSPNFQSVSAAPLPSVLLPGQGGDRPERGRARVPRRCAPPPPARRGARASPQRPGAPRPGAPHTHRCARRIPSDGTWSRRGPGLLLRCPRRVSAGRAVVGSIGARHLRAWGRPRGGGPGRPRAQRGGGRAEVAPARSGRALRARLRAGRTPRRRGAAPGSGAPPGPPGFPRARAGYARLRAPRSRADWAAERLRAPRAPRGADRSGPAPLRPRPLCERTPPPRPAAAPHRPRARRGPSPRGLAARGPALRPLAGRGAWTLGRTGLRSWRGAEGRAPRAPAGRPCAHRGDAVSCTESAPSQRAPRQSLGRVRLSATPSAAARQASRSVTNSRSLPKLHVH